MSFKISVVIPTYNEEGNIELLYDKLLAVLNKYNDFEIIYVDDGSSDQSLTKIKEINSRDEKVKYLSFSRNFGHQSALRAGLQKATGDCAMRYVNDNGNG